MIAAAPPRWERGVGRGLCSHQLHGLCSHQLQYLMHGRVFASVARARVRSYGPREQKWSEAAKVLMGRETSCEISSIFSVRR